MGNEMQLLEKNYPQHRFFNTDVKELDITNQLAINDFVNRNQIDGIVNCAAYTAVDKAETDKKLCTALNTEAPAYLAAAVDNRRLLHANVPELRRAQGLDAAALAQRIIKEQK